MRFFLSFFLLLFLWGSVAQASVLSIQEVVSEKGIKAWLVEDYSLPLLSVSFSFKGGVETDSKEQQGELTLMSSLLTQGAGPYSDKAFQEELAKHSIAMDVSAGRDYIYGSMKMLKRKEGQAFALLKEALTHPRFDQEVLDRVRDQQSVSSRAQLASPSWQGRYALFQALYKEHPYGYRSLGTTKTLQGITSAGLKKRAKVHLTKEHLHIAVVGAISANKLKKYLDQTFGGLPEKGALPVVSAFEWPSQPQKNLIKREGAQTFVLFAAPMMKRTNPDWYAAKIANYILGGGSFNARLMKAVRAREGLTYGISTGLSPMDKSNLIVGNFSTDNSKTEKAVDLVYEEWKKFYEQGVSEAEVQAAKDYLIGAMALALTSTDQIASLLRAVQNENLGIDYLEHRADKYKAVSRQDVQRVIKKWFNPEKAFYSFVGMPENLAVDQKQALVME